MNTARLRNICVASGSLERSGPEVFMKEFLVFCHIQISTSDIKADLFPIYAGQQITTLCL